MTVEVACVVDCRDLLGESPIRFGSEPSRLRGRFWKLYLNALLLSGKQLIDFPGTRRERDEQATDGTETHQQRS